MSSDVVIKSFCMHVMSNGSEVKSLHQVELSRGSAAPVAAEICFCYIKRGLQRVFLNNQSKRMIKALATVHKRIHAQNYIQYTCN